MKYGSRFDRCRWAGCKTECVDEIELCGYHFALAGKTYIEARSVFGAAAMAERRQQREAEEVIKRESTRTVDDWAQDRSVVYYMRIGDHVKIGYTTLLPDRVRQLRLNPDAVLAVEPGWKEREAERHRQFAHERVSRREDFNPSRRLLLHIDATRSKYGEPYGYAKRRVDMAGPRPLAS